MIDRKSRKEFGPQNGRQFSDADIGVNAEINGREVTIVGHFELGTGLTADGCILVNAMAFPRFVPARRPDELSFGLVRLQEGPTPTRPPGGCANASAGHCPAANRATSRS